MKLISRFACSFVALALAASVAAAPANWPILTSVLSQADTLVSSVQAQVTSQLAPLSTAGAQMVSQIQAQIDSAQEQIASQIAPLSSAEAQMVSQIQAQVSSGIQNIQSEVSSINSQIAAACKGTLPAWMCMGSGS